MSRILLGEKCYALKSLKLNKDKNGTNERNEKLGDFLVILRHKPFFPTKINQNVVQSQRTLDQSFSLGSK